MLAKSWTGSRSTTASAIGLRDGVLGGVLERGGEQQEPVDVLTVGGHGVAQGHPARGDGARLVEQHDVDGARVLEGLGSLDEDAELGAAARPDQERRRRRQAEGARAGDHEHGDGGGERRSGPRAGAEPEAERRGGDDEDDGHEHSRDPVGQPLGGGLAVLGVLDEPRHLRELGVGPDARGPHDQPPAGVDRGAHDGVPDPDLDGDGLTGEHRGVDRRGALLDDPVGGHLLPRPDDEPVADDEVGGGHAHLGPAAQHRHVAGPQVEQRAEGRPRPPLRPRLDEAPEQHERGDAGRRLEVDRAGAVGALDDEAERVLHARVAGRAEEQGVERPAEGGEGADRDEGVHGGRRVPQVGPRGTVERQPAPHHDRGGEDERQPLPVLELQRRNHRHRDDGHGQHGRDEQAVAERPGGVGRLGLVRVLGRGGQRGRVAGRRDGGEQVVGRHGLGERDARLLGGVVDARLDAVELVELALDAVGARRRRSCR